MAGSVTASEARNRFGRLLNHVSRGEEIVVTRHDKPVARLVPAGRPERDEVRAAAAGLRELRGAIIARRQSDLGFTSPDLESLIDEGCR